MSVLVLGGDSTLGAFVARRLREQSVNVFTTTRDVLKVDSANFYFDFKEEPHKWTILDYKFESVVICAAITSIKYCEDNPQESYLVNYLRSAELMKRLLNKGTHVIFLSTNLVFDGRQAFQKDSDQLNPRTIYGLHKSLVENELMTDQRGRLAILRLSKVLTHDFHLFKQWINLMKGQNRIYPILDMYFSPISSELVFNVIDKLIRKKGVGLYQLSSSSDISYLDAAIYLSKKLNICKNLITGVTAASVGLKAAAFNSTMDTTKVENLLGVKTQTSYQSIDCFLSHLLPRRELG